jgi:hypothetical protein
VGPSAPNFPFVADVTLHAAVALLVDGTYDAMERVREEFVEAYGVGAWPPRARVLFDRLRQAADAMESVEEWLTVVYTDETADHDD